MMTTNLRAMPNRTCAAILQPMDSLPVPSTPPLRCPTCGYDLHAADLAAPCPECGTAGADALKPSLVNHATRGSLLANFAGAVVLIVPPLLMLAVVLVALLLRRSLLAGVNPRLYDTLQVMLLVAGTFLLTNTGGAPQLHGLRVPARWARGAASVFGASIAWLLYPAREIVLHSGEWVHPLATPFATAVMCLLPASMIAGMISLWCYMDRWFRMGRIDRARTFTAVAFAIALISPAQMVTQAIVRYASAVFNSPLARWTAMPGVAHPWLHLVSTLLWILLATRFALAALRLARLKSHE